MKLIDRRAAIAAVRASGLLLVAAWLCANACAYEVETHTDISEAAAINSFIAEPLLLARIRLRSLPIGNPLQNISRHRQFVSGPSCSSLGSGDL